MPSIPDPKRRSESARRAILDSALTLCEEAGYAKLSIEAIALRSKVGKQTIYRWWPSKGAVLLEAVMERAAISASHPDTGDLAEDILTQLLAVIALLTPHQTSPLAALIAEALRDDDLATRLREQLILPNIELFEARIRSAQRSHELPADANLTLLNDLFHGTIYHRFVFHLGMPGEAELRERIAVVIAGVQAVSAES